jgi:hypothetical protein
MNTRDKNRTPSKKDKNKKASKSKTKIKAVKNQIDTQNKGGKNFIIIMQK